jgi:hypothetical protein
MMPVAIYGWKCLKKDKVLLLKRLNLFLAKHRQKITESPTRRLFDGYLPFEIRHFYWNLNQELGTWFDVYPNEDLKGKHFFPDHQECAWLIHVRIDIHRYANIIPEAAETFVQELLDSAMFEHRVIRESGDLLKGLPRGHIDPTRIPARF